MRLVFSFLLVHFSLLLSAQAGEWEGHLTQDGVKYDIHVVFEKEGKNMIGYTTVVVGDTLTGGKIFGRVNSDYSMNLWDHQENPQIFPDSLPIVMRRRYQLLYRRSVWGDTIKGHWQQVHKAPEDKYKKGLIELTRRKKDPKA